MRLKILLATVCLLFPLVAFAGKQSVTGVATS
jgi:hypothetical protein